MKIKYVALSLLLASATSIAATNECVTTVTGNDAMQFDTKAITVSKTCKEFTVNLVHSGKLPKTSMGHNWVLSKTADAQPIAADGIAAGLDHNYIKPGDARVIATTTLIGGGEKTSVKFPVSKLKEGETYTFFCSAPGHIAVMQGSLTVK